MANIIGEIKAYHNGKIYSIADIYDGTISDSNVKGYIQIYHNGNPCYVPLSDTQSLKKTPCFEINHGGNSYFALQVQSTELNAKISETVTYGDTGTIKITGNAAGVKVTATVPSTYSDYLKVNSTTSNTVVVECTKYTSSKIPVTINVAASGSYASGTCKVNVTTAKADIEPYARISSSTITYNTSQTVTVNGNTGNGAISVGIPSAYSNFLTATVNSNTVKLQCTNYTEDTIPVTINIAATNNYAAASISIPIKTARTAISPSATVSGTITYGTEGTISISGNTGKGNVSLSVDKANYDCLLFSDITSNSAKVTCTNYKSSAIPVTVKIEANGNYASGTCKVNVTTAKANLTLSASSTTVTYNATKNLTLNGNDGEGAVTATVTSYTDCLTVQSTTTNTITLKCIKYTANTVPIKINVAATNNYNSGTTTVNVTTAKAEGVLKFDDTPSSFTLTYGQPFTFTATENLSGGKLVLSTPSDFDKAVISSISGNSITLKCTNYNSSYDSSGNNSLKFSVVSSATDNYNSKWFSYFYAKLKKANLTLSVDSDTVTYDSTCTLTISGNSGGGAVTAEVTNNTDCLIVSSTTTSTVTVKCTKYTSNKISVKVSVAATNNYNAATYTVKVATARKKLTAAQSSFTFNGSLTYDGTEKSVADYLSGYNSTYHTLSSDTKATNAGTYTVKITPKANFAFSDGSTAAKSVDWNITPKRLTKPSLTYTTATYDGNSHAPTINDFNSTYENKSGTDTAVNADTYTLEFTLKNTSNTTWSDSSTGKVTCTWTINKKLLDYPAFAPNDFTELYSVTYFTTYNTKTITPATIHDGSSEVTITGTTSAKDTGTRTITCSVVNSNYAFKLPQNSIGGARYRLNEKGNGSSFNVAGNVSSVDLTWTILTRQLAQPYLTDTTFTYDKQNHSPTEHDFDSTYEGRYGMGSTPSAGTYSLTYSLKSTTNTAWTDGSTSPVTREWCINKRELTKPSLKDNTYTFDGDSHSPTVLNYDYDYELQAGTDTATNVGTYSLTYSLRSTSNTSWADGSTDKVTLDWYINKLKLLVPTLSNATQTFDGTIKAPTVNNFISTYETQKGTDAATNANTYHLTYSLKDTVNTIWNGGTTNDFVRDWVINPASTGQTPYLTASTYTYDKAQHEPTIKNYDSTTMDINSTSVLKATNAGTYSITFNTKKNYVLPNGDKYIICNWVIHPISVDEATLSATHVIYDGSQKGVSLNFPAANKSLVYENGDLTGTNAGAYTYSLAFKDTQNYIWTNRKNSEQLDLVWYIDKASGCIPVTSSYSEDTSVVAMATVNCGYQTSGSTWYQNTNWELVSWSVTWFGTAAEGGNKSWSSTSAGTIETNIYNSKFVTEWSARGDTAALLKIEAISGGLPNDNNTYEVQVNLRCSNPNFTDVNEWTEVSRFWIKGTEVSILHRQPNGTWT